MNLAEIVCSSPLAALTLLGLKGIGPKSVIKLCNNFGILADIRMASPVEQKKYVPGAALDTLNDPNAWRQAYQQAEKTLETASKLQVTVLAYQQPEYPRLLASIPDPPPVVLLKGQLEPNQKRAACVGTREPTSFGIEVTRRLVRVLVEDGWSIVSGLALGVDTLAHEETVTLHGHTIAVLANGLDSIYPKQNAALAERILDTGGCLLSEQVFGSRATGPALISRDRIQSGLSVATVVMQTDVKGGTMHTVRFALMQGRRVCVPYPPEQYRSEAKSQGLIALATHTGKALAATLNAEGAYRELLVRQYPTTPAARVLKGQSDYPVFLQELNALNKLLTTNHPRTDDQPLLFSET